MEYLNHFFTLTVFEVKSSILNKFEYFEAIINNMAYSKLQKKIIILEINSLGRYKFNKKKITDNIWNVT